MGVNYCSYLMLITVSHVMSNRCKQDCQLLSMYEVTMSHVMSNRCEQDCHLLSLYKVTMSHAMSNRCEQDCQLMSLCKVTMSHVMSNRCEQDCQLLSLCEVTMSHVMSNRCEQDCQLLSLCQTYTWPCEERSYCFMWLVSQTGSWWSVCWTCWNLFMHNSDHCIRAHGIKAYPRLQPTFLDCSQEFLGKWFSALCQHQHLHTGLTDIQKAYPKCTFF